MRGDRSVEKRLAKAGKKLPAKAKKAAGDIVELEKRIRHQPYTTRTQARSLERAQKKLDKFSTSPNEKQDRRRARANWLIGLILSYALFLVVLAGFWYIATQM